MPRAKQLLKTSALSTAALALSGISIAHADPDDLWQPQVRAIIGADNRGANAAIEGFIPLKQTAESVLFLDVRGKHRFDDGFGQDVGIGVRRLVNPDLLIGGYAYANVQTIDGHTFSGATLGIEAISASYDGHLNVYLPFGGDGNDTKGNSSLSLVGNQLLEQISILDRRSYSAWGIEGEFGVQMPLDLPDNHSLRLDVGGYHFADPDGRDGSVTGAKAGIEYAIRDTFNSGWDLTLAGEVRSDNRDHTQFAGSIQLSVPFNPPARNASQEEISTAYPVSEGLRKRLNERVRGNIGVRVNTQETTRELTRNAINAATGKAFGTFFFADGENSLGLGTQGDPTTLDDAVARAGKDGFVVALGGKGNILTGGVILTQGQTVIGGAGTVKALSYFGNTQTFSFGGSNGTVAGTNGGKPVLSLANGNTISGITVTGGSVGISGTGINGATLTDVTVTGTGSHGVAFTGTSTGVAGTNLTSGGNAGDGLHIESDGTFNFTGTTLLSGNAGDGLDIKGKGTYAFATLNAQNNAGDGIHVSGTSSSGKFSTTGGTVSGNGGTGVFIDPITTNVVLDQISQKGGAAGIVLDQVSGSFTVTGKTTITGTAGAGISISNAPAAIRFGDVEISTPGGDGISFAGVNTAVVAGNIVISGLGLGATGLDFSGSQTVFTAQSASISGGAIGIDLAGTLAGSKIAITNGGTIVNGTTGVRLGIAGSLAGTANADFSFGGGTIGGSVASLDARGLNPGAGAYAFSTTVFTGAQLFDARNLMFVGASATGSGDGSSINNLATIAQADANTAGDVTFILVNRGTVINATNGFTLETGQILASFGNGRSFSLGGVPLNVTGTNVQNGATITDAGGAATLTSTAGSPTVAMASTTSLLDVNLTNANPGGGTVVEANAVSNIILTGVAISGGTTGLRGTSVNGAALTNVSVSGATQDGVAFDGTSTNIAGVNLTSTGNGSNGLLISSDGLFSFTGTTLLSGNTASGLDIKGKGTYAFATLNAQNNSGDGIDVSGTSTTGRFSTTGGSISGNGGTAVSVDLITADVVLDQVNQSGGTSGIALNQASGSFAITGKTGITGTSGAGIAISSTPAAVHFGDVTIDQPAANAITVKGTNGTISFGNVDVTGLCNCGIGLDLSSSTSTFTAATLDIGGTAGAGSTGIDLSGTNGGSITIGGGVIGGVGTGIQLGSHGIAGTRANTTLNFGAAGGSSIGGTVASLDTRGLLASSGSYEFNTTVFNGPQLFDPINVIFVGSAATGIGDGSSVDNLADINFADGITTANVIFALVNDGAAINDPTGFTLSDGQTLASFGNGRTFNRSGAPINVTGGANITRGGTQIDPTGNGAATFTNSGGNTLTLGNGNLVADLIVNSSAVAINGAGGITDFISSGVVVNGATTALDLTGAAGTITVNNLTIQGPVQSGLVLKNTVATFNFTGTTAIAGGSAAALLANNFNGTATFADLDITGGAGFGISIENGSTGTLTFGASSSITSPLGTAFSVDNSASTVTYNGTITQNNAASAVSLTTNAGGMITFGAITATTAGAKAISIANNTGGTYNFAGQVNANTTTATAVMLDTNTGATINFTGGLDITTTGGDGLTAINGGTLTVTGSGNTIASDGNGLLMGGMNVGATGINFDSISADSSIAGIALSGVTLTGDVNIGGLKVTGVNGGAFSGLTGPGKVNLTGTIDLDLTDPNSIGFDFGGQIGTVNIANATGSTLTIDGAWLGIQFSGAQGGTANIGGNGGSATITAAQATGSAIALNGNTIGGPVLNYTGALNVSAGNVVSTAGADLAVLNLAGTVTSTTNDTAFNFAVASGTYNILSLITHAGGTGVNVGPGALATGTITFSSASKTFSTGTNNAVSMAGLGTLSFTNGGLGITTSSGIGLGAVSGTVKISGGTGNTINSMPGTAVSLSGTTADITLNSITAAGGLNGVSLSTMSGSFSVSGTTQVSNTTGGGIVLAGNSGTVSFLGTTTITSLTTAAVKINGTNGAISFADLDIALTAANTTGFDVSGAVVNANITATDFDLTSASATNTTGVNLVGTTGTGLIQLGDGSAPASGQNASIAGTLANPGGPTTGVLVSSATNVDFIFGDGEGSTDVGSSITAVTPIAATDALPNHGTDVYNFLDVTLTGDTSNLSSPFSVYYVDNFDDGTNNGSRSNPGTIAGAIASGRDIIVLVNNGGTIDVNSAFQGAGTTLTLANNQRLYSFLAGDTINVGGGAPASFLLTGVDSGNITNPASGTPTLTTSAAAANTVTLANNNVLQGVLVTSGPGGYGVSGTGSNTLTITGSNVGGLRLSSATGMANLGDTLFSHIHLAGGSIVLTATNADISSTTAVNAFEISGGHTGNVTFDAASTISQTGTARGVSITGKTAGTVTFSGLVTANTGAAEGVFLSGNTGATFNFDGGLDIDTTAGTGFTATGGGTINVASSASNTINSTGGQAINLANITSNITFASIVAGGGARGISLDAVAGSFTVSGTTTVNGSTDAGIQIQNSSANATFTGKVTILNGIGANGDGVWMDTNTGTYDFNGGVDITVNGTGAFGLRAHNSGTVNIANVAGNQITSNNGTALSIDPTVFNAIFDSLTAGGGVNGVLLDQMSGSLTVTGMVTINNSTGNGLMIANSAGTVSLGSVAINGTAGNGVDISGANGAITISGGSIGDSNDPGGIGVKISGGTAAVTINASVTKTTAGDLIEVSGRTAGTVSFGGNLSSSAQGGGIDVNGNSGTAVISFSGATKTINTSASGAAAVSLVNNGGATINFLGGGLAISSGAGTGLNATGGGTINVTGSANQISTTTGTAVNLDTVVIGAGNVTFDTTNKTATGGTSAVVLNTVTGGSIDLGSGTLNGGSGAVIRVGDGAGGANTGGTAGLVYSGNIVSGTGQAVNIQDRAAGAQNITLSGNITHGVSGQTGILLDDNAAGTITFSGASKSISSGSATAVSLTDNGGATVSFLNGGLNITASGTGFLATGGGTINVVSGAGTNAITTNTATGTGVDLNGITIGAGNIGFATVNVDGAATGIRVTNVTGSGLFISGGTIQNTTTAAVDISGGGSSINFANMTISNSAGRSLSVVGRGSGAISFGGGTLTDTGQGMLFQNNTGGSTTFSGGTRSVNVAGANNALTVINSASHSVSFGGTTTLQTTGAGNAVDISNGATLAFTGTAINANGSGAALQADGGGTIVITGTGALSAGATATAVSLDTVAVGAGGITFASTSKTAGGTTAVLMSNVTGTGTVNLGTGTLNGGSGAVIRIGDGAGGANTGGTAGLTYGGNIVSGTGQAINIQDRAAGAQNITLSGNITHSVSGQTGILLDDNAAGTITFSGISKTITSGSATAVNLTDNTGATVSFTGGGLAITTTTGSGFTATGGGTITVQGSNNSISSTTGTALNIANTTIGAAGATFRSITSNGAASGIILNNTGTQGGLTVTGDGSTAGSGGTIQNSTGDGVSLTDTQNVGLGYMTISDNAGSGIQGLRVNGVVLNRLTLNSNASSVADAGILFNELTGDATHVTTFSNLVVSNSFQHNVQVINSGGNLTNLVVSASTFSNDGSSNNAGSNFIFEADGAGVAGTPTMKLTVDGSTFTGNNAYPGPGVIPGTGLFVIANDGTVNAHIGETTGNIFNNLNNGINLTQSSNAGLGTGGNLNFTVRNNTVTNSDSTAINVFSSGDLARTLDGIIQNNTIGTQGVAISGSRTGFGIRVGHESLGVAKVLMDNNTIQSIGVNGISGGESINITQLVQPGTVHATITNNTIRDNAESRAITITATFAGATINADVHGNAITNVNNANAIRFIADGLGATDGTINLPQASDPAVEAANGGATVLADPRTFFSQSGPLQPAPTP